MIKKIFIYILNTAIISILLESVIILGISFSVISKQNKSNILYEINSISQQINTINKNNDSEEQVVSYLNSISNISNNKRITLLDNKGNVFYDSKVEPSLMENHLSRPEIIMALEKGIGNSERYSETILEKNYYAAIVLNNNSILRLSYPTKSIWTYIVSIIEPFFIIIFLLMIASTIIAKRLSKKLIQPILSIDLDNPENSITYDEMTPLLTKISNQNKQIKKTMDEIEKQQREFNAITSKMREGLIVINSQKQIISINNSALDLFSGQDKNYIGSLVFDLNRNIEFEQLVNFALQGNVCEKEITQNKLWYSFSCTPVFTDEVLSGCIILIRDVTEQKQAENLRREFTANVSHELKTPLTSISGYAEIIKSNLVEEKDIPEFAQRIFDETNRLILLVQDIIKLSQLDEISEEKEKKLFTKYSNIELSEDVDLFELAKNTIQTLDDSAKKRNIDLFLQGDSCLIKGNKLILQEVFYNVCDNAIKYNKENGNVLFQIKETNKKISVIIKDSGIGIPKDEQEKIFERFYRVDKSRSRKTGGTGLGLSIVKHGVEIHNGKIKLSSKVGEGTTIEIVFSK